MHGELAKGWCLACDERFGWFSPRSGDAVISGQLYTTYLDFTVWKKTGD